MRLIELAFKDETPKPVSEDVRIRVEAKAGEYVLVRDEDDNVRVIKAVPDGKKGKRKD